MSIRIFFGLAILPATLAFTQSGCADVRLPKIFGDGMVLQREKPITIGGWADPGESVTIAFGDRSTTTAANAAGRRRTELSPRSADGTSREFIVRGKNTITLSDVVAGDVWLCSGQSNMSISAGHFFAVPEVKQDLAAAKFPLIRHFGVQEHFADETQEDVAGGEVRVAPFRTDDWKP